MMSKKTTVCFLLGLGVVIGYNVFLAQRDAKLFEAYNQPTPKELYCQQQAGWHPDCKVE